MRNSTDNPSHSSLPSVSARRVAAGLIVALFTCMIIQLRADYLNALGNANTLTSAVAHAIDQHLGGSIRSIDSLLDEVASAVEGQRADNPEFSAHMLSRLSAFPEIRYIGVANAKGRLQTRTWPAMRVPDGGLDISDRAYFAKQLHATGPAHLVVGQPVIGRISGQRTVHLSRPLHDADGKFAGIVFAAVNTDRYADFLSTMMLDPNGASAMIGLDGRMIARAPDYQDTFGRDISASALLGIWVPRAPVGVADLVALTDGHSKFLAYRVLDGYPLLVTAGISKHMVLSHWWWMLGLESLLLLIISGALYYWARQADLRSTSLINQHAQLEAAVSERTSLLATSERRLSQVLSGTSDGFWDWDIASGACNFSDRWREMFGFPPDATPPTWQAWLERVHMADRKTVQSALDDCLNGRIDRYAVEYRYRPHSGERWLWVMSRAAIIRDESGQALQLAGTDTDITERKNAEAELRATSSRLKLVLETVAEGIIGLDDESRIIFANPAAAQILNWKSPTTMLGGGKAFDILGHILADGSHCNGTVCPITLTLTDGQTRRVANEWFRTADGQLRPVEYVVSPLKVEDLVVGVTLVFHDVTERRQAEAEITRLMEFRRAILDCAGNAIIATNTDGIITLFNATAEAWLGYSSDELVGHFTPQLFHDPDEVAQHVQKLSQELGESITPGFPIFVAKCRASGQTDVQEWTYIRRDGTRFPVLLSTSVLLDTSGEVTGYLGVAQDISSIKLLEQDLKRSNAELERFAYVASHDLREPLRMISSYVAMLERSLGDRLNADEREFIGFAVDGARRMDRMIIDLLEYSRIGRSPVRDEPVPLNDALAAALANLRQSLEGAEITAADDMPVICGSLSQLERLFRNLIGNALKFHATDRSPTVQVGWRETAQEWVVWVRDNGIGIDPKDYDRLFVIFQRLVPRSQYDGTGIGLAACRKIMEHHGGRIWVESEPNQGSTFFLAFPKARCG